MCALTHPTDWKANNLKVKTTAPKQYNTPNPVFTCQQLMPNYLDTA